MTNKKLPMNTNLKTFDQLQHDPITQPGAKMRKIEQITDSEH
jgi:hypothetical protein